MADYEVEVLVRGRPVQIYRHDGDFFIEGRRGSTYELKFYNNTWQRVEIVISVDGMSVMKDGQAGPSDSGYLVPARGSIIVPGFRRDMNNVAEFQFSDKGNSYSNAMGNGTTNVGVIGFMVFKEKQHIYPVFTTSQNPFTRVGDSGSFTPYPYSNVSMNSTYGMSPRVPNNSPIVGSGSSIAATCVTSSADSEKFDLGTTWGDEKSHNVTEVSFDRQNPHVADRIITIYYDSLRNLEKRGIKVKNYSNSNVYEKPNPFPGYTKGCTPPPGWRKR